MRPGGAAIAIALLVLSGCALGKPEGDPLRPEGGAPPARAAPIVTAAPGSEVAAPRTPHVYMALQPGGAGPLSIIFAIDASRDGTPGDDPAIRLTPENGKCNPQDLRRYAFPADAVLQPVYGPAQQAEGVTARDLPNFMAMAVTAEMLRLGIITDPGKWSPHNICTRKLWEQMFINESLRAG